MRARRSKKYRKIMSSYQISFSFREPYQVLLDSHFLKTCHSFHMPLQKYLENTLHGKCNLFMTRCTLAKIMGEWEKMREKAAKTGEGRPRGLGRPEFLPPPMEVPLRHCKHKNDEGEELGVVSEARCLLDLLAGQPHGNEHAKNKQHYILATADAGEREQRSRGFIDVRDRARLIPGVPIVYVKRSVMILEEMSSVSERTIRKAEKDKFGDGLIGLASRKRKRGEGEEESEDEDEDLLGQETQGEPKTRGTRKAKGPNPLSVKKKKVKAPLSQGEDREGLAIEGEVSRKKPTRRGGRRGTARRKSMAGENNGGAVKPETGTAATATSKAEA